MAKNNNLKLISMNVCGLNEKIKRTKVFRFLRSKEIDVACIQETHLTKSKHRIIKNEWNGKVVYNDGESNSRGVAVFFAKHLDVQNVSVDRDLNGRFVSVAIKLNEQSLRIVNVYAPNGDCPAFFTDVFQKIQNYTEDHIILMGDFNQILNVKLDRKGGSKTENTTKSANIINIFMGRS